jgi:hypothetical protein
MLWLFIELSNSLLLPINFSDGSLYCSTEDRGTGGLLVVKIIWPNDWDTWTFLLCRLVIAVAVKVFETPFYKLNNL